MRLCSRNRRLLGMNLWVLEHVLELINRHVLQRLREQLEIPGSRLEGSELVNLCYFKFTNSMYMAIQNTCRTRVTQTNR